VVYLTRLKRQLTIASSKPQEALLKATRLRNLTRTAIVDKLYLTIFNLTKAVFITKQSNIVIHCSSPDMLL
jgi:hypothetical protein